MSKLDIANKTLRLVGVSYFISDYDSDDSPTASTVRLFFDETYNNTLTSHNWHFCSDYDSPPLISNNKNTSTHTGGKWQNAYQRPVNALLIRKVQSSNQDVKYSVGNFLAERVIFCNAENITVNTTKKTDDFSLVPEYIKTLITYNLAVAIWHTIKGELNRDFDKLYGVRNAAYEQAKKNDNQQFYQEVKTETTWIEAR